MDLVCNFEYAKDIKEFARQIVWYPCRERDLIDFDEFLVFLLAHGGQRAIGHARGNFGVTDEDFHRAIAKARPGVFITKEDWNIVNRQIGIDPPLPYPTLNLEELIADARPLEI